MKKFSHQSSVISYQLSDYLKTENRRLKTENRKFGFTLIELLVAVSIIGVLSTLVLANFNAARERARDAQRKSDLRQVQNALRTYYNDIGVYPENFSATDFRIKACGTGGLDACAWGGDWSPYMNPLSKDPQSPTRDYRYTRTSLDNYTLKACLENKSDQGCSATSESWCNTDLNGCVFEVKQ